MCVWVSVLTLNWKFANKSLQFLCSPPNDGERFVLHWRLIHGSVARVGATQTAQTTIFWGGVKFSVTFRNWCKWTNCGTHTGKTLQYIVLNYGTQDLMLSNWWPFWLQIKRRQSILVQKEVFWLKVISRDHQECFQKSIPVQVKWRETTFPL